MKVQIDRIARDIEIINSFTSTPGKGVTRFTFSEPYMQARAYVTEELQKIGARVATTLGGNLCGRRFVRNRYAALRGEAVRTCP